MTIWHKNGTEDMTQWSTCLAPEPCICNTDWPDKEMCAGPTAVRTGIACPTGEHLGIVCTHPRAEGDHQ